MLYQGVWRSMTVMLENFEQNLYTVQIFGGPRKWGGGARLLQNKLVVLSIALLGNSYIPVVAIFFKHVTGSFWKVGGG